MSRWRSISIACLVLVASCSSIALSQATSVKSKKVSVTLVRWPYT
jgi:hypothetical protein